MVTLAFGMLKQAMEKSVDWNPLAEFRCMGMLMIWLWVPEQDSLSPQ
jgi:hypothetical protein